MGSDSTRDTAPTESLRDFVARFSGAFSLDGDGDHTTNPTLPNAERGQTGSIARESITQLANYDVSIPAESGNATEEVDNGPRLQFPAARVEDTCDNKELQIPPSPEFIVTEVGSSKDSSQTRSAPGLIDPDSASPPIAATMKPRRPVGSIGARSGKFDSTDPNAVINGWKSYYGLTWRSSVVKMPSSDARILATSASPILIEPRPLQSASIPIHAQNEITQAGGDFFHVKIPLLGRQSLELEPKVYSLSALRMRKENREREALTLRLAITGNTQMENPQQRKRKPRRHFH